MKLTTERKAYIDSLSYDALLSRWRFAPVGDQWFTDESGQYWSDRMAELRKQDNLIHVAASKKIGW